MSLRISTNIASLTAQRSLQQTQKAIARSLERLASGNRLAQSGDDPAGLAASEGLTAQVRAARQVVRHANDAAALIDRADSAMSIQTELLQRMRELALQAANGSLSSEERGHLHEEFRTLLDEINRITETTTFGSTPLLDGGLGEIKLQVGANKGDTLDLSLPDTRQDILFADTLESTSETEPLGTFTASSSTVTAPGSSPSINHGDFNGDGFNDLILNVNSSATVALNDGTGNFSTGQTVTMNSSTTRYTLGDINNDGILDLAAVGGSNAITVRLGNGDGTFGSVITTSIGYHAHRIALGDLDNDGVLDVVVQGLSLDYATIYTGDGSGTFTHTQTISGLGTSNLTDDIAIGDIDGDGVNDLAILETLATQTLHAYLSNGDGTVTFASTRSVSQWEFLHASDINQDGLMDLSAANSVSGNSGYGWVLSNGNGTFTARLGVSSGVSLGTVKDVFPLGDFNGDGFMDALMTGSSTTTGYIAYGNGTGFDAAISVANLATSTNRQHYVMDLNNDGFADVLQWAQGNSTVQGILQNTLTTVTTTGTAVDLSLESQEQAENILDPIDQAIQVLSAYRSQLGATRNRLDSIQSTQQTLVENLEGARSQLADVDYAAETAELVKNQIMQQAAVGVLGQANVSLRIALQLLQNI
jgi:flagellin